MIKFEMIISSFSILQICYDIQSEKCLSILFSLWLSHKFLFAYYWYEVYKCVCVCLYLCVYVCVCVCRKTKAGQSSRKLDEMMLPDFQNKYRKPSGSLGSCTLKLNIWSTYMPIICQTFCQVSRWRFCVVIFQYCSHQKWLRERQRK